MIDFQKNMLSVFLSKAKQIKFLFRLFRVL